MDYTDKFHLDAGTIYLNHAAVSPWSQSTVDAVRRFADENGRRGSLDYARWLRTETELREQLRQLLNAPSTDDIALVKNTSEALSMIAWGLDWSAGDNIVSSNQEFPSNRIVWESLAPLRVELRQVTLESGTTPEDTLFSNVDDKTKMISISSVQYATGLRMDLEKIGRFCRERGILFCVDAIQSIGVIPFDLEKCMADFVAADGHKWMLGPEGLGLFYCRAELRDRLSLNQFGWHMVEEPGNFDQSRWRVATNARRFECGSPNMLGIHALNASLALILDVGIDEIYKIVIDNSRYLIEELTAIGFTVITPTEEMRRAGIVSFNHPDHEVDKIYEYLSNHGLFCAVRSGNIRFSPHFYCTREQLEQSIRLLRKYVA